MTLHTNTLAILLGTSLLASGAHAAEFMKFNDLLASDTARKQLARGVGLYWLEAKAPPFSQPSLPETYTSTSFSPSPFGGSRRHCVNAFENVLAALIDDAESRGYDLITNVRPVVDGAPLSNVEGFDCKPGYKITMVSVAGILARSEAAAKKFTEAEQASLKVAPRAAAAGAIFLPLEPALLSKEAKTPSGSTPEVHLASPSMPFHQFRFGPDDYADSAELTTEGPEVACRQAVSKALESMKAEAKERKYSMVINVRSRLDGNFSPDFAQFECAVGKKTVSVNCQASLAAK